MDEKSKEELLKPLRQFGVNLIEKKKMLLRNLHKSGESDDKLTAMVEQICRIDEDYSKAFSQVIKTITSWEQN